MLGILLKFKILPVIYKFIPGFKNSILSNCLIREAEQMAEIVRKIGKITRYETTSYVGHQKIFDLDRAADGPSEPGTKG